MTIGSPEFKAGMIIGIEGYPSDLWIILNITETDYGVNVRLNDVDAYILKVTGIGERIRIPIDKITKIYYTADRDHKILQCDGGDIFKSEKVTYYTQWIRKKDTVKEMTVSDISRELGYPIKVVEG